MKILFVSQYFPPEMGAPAARVYELARRWVQEGHAVTVLTGFPNHPRGVLAPEYRRKWRRLLWRERVDGIRLLRTWLLPFPNRKAHERMLNYASFWLSSSLTGMFLPRPDVVVATSPQLLVGLTGWWLGLVKQAPFVFEVRDLWPESLTAVGMHGEESLLYRTLEGVARFLYRRCGRLVVVTPAFKDHLIAHWGVAGGKIFTVENGVETELFAPGEAEETRARLGLRDRFVVSYIGTLGMAHGLDTVLEAAAHFPEAARVRFLLVGEGAEKERLQSQAAARSLRNVVFLGEQAKEQVPALIRASDVCLVPLKKQNIFRTVIPTKMLECMSCARPVILGVEGQAKEIVEGAQAGLCIEPENAEALAAAIRQLEADAGLRKRLGANGRRRILEQYSREQMAAKYLSVLRGLEDPGVRMRPAGEAV